MGKLKFFLFNGINICKDADVINVEYLYGINIESPRQSGEWMDQ